jgi:hypothetical protein
LKLDLKFQEFNVGQTFKSHILIDKDDFQKYISFAKTKNILHEKPELAAKEGIKGTLLPGQAIISLESFFYCDFAILPYCDFVFELSN